MENLKLTPLTEENCEEYLNLVSEIYNEKDSLMRKYTPGFAAQTKQDFFDILDSKRNTGGAIIGIRLPNNQLIGAIGLDNPFIKGTREVSFAIAKDFRNKHYATEALALLIQKLRGTDIKQLVFTVSKNNKASLNIVTSKLETKYDHDYEDDMEVHILDI